jgi:hypothetical protein
LADADVWLPCALAAITEAASATTARPIAFFIYFSSLPGAQPIFSSGGFGAEAGSVIQSRHGVNDQISSVA